MARTKTAPVSAPVAHSLSVDILQDTLAEGLGIVSRSVPAKTALPILSNIMLTAEAGSLTFTASNLSVSVVHRASADVSTPGTITLPARLLADYVAQLEAGQTIGLTLKSDSDKLHLACGRYSANIPGLKSEDFPPVPAVGVDAGLSMPAADLKAALSQVAFCAATDDSRPVLAGVLVTVAAGVLTLAAADGFRLAARSIPLPDGGADMSIIVPAASILEVARLLPDEADVSVSIAASEMHASFAFGDTTVTTRLIPGVFPDYQRIIPAADALVSKVKLATKDALRATRAAGVFARDNSNIVRLTWDAATDADAGVVAFASTSAESGDTEGTVDAVIEGVAMATAYNGRYLRDAIQAIDSEELVLSVAGPTSPGILRAVDGGGALYVVMPMHTSN